MKFAARIVPFASGRGRPVNLRFAPCVRRSRTSPGHDIIVGEIVFVYIVGGGGPDRSCPMT
jgi:hypothetical protein